MTHKHRDPSFFLMKRIGEAAQEELARMKDCERLTSIYFLTFLSSDSDIKYIRPKDGLEPSISSIA